MLRPRLVENWYHTAGGTPLAQGCLISGVDPEPRGFGLVLPFALALLEQLDRGIIHEDGLRFKHMIADRVRQAFQQLGAFADPPRHERSAQIDAFVLKHLGLSIERQVIAVFAAQDMGHQRGTDKALGNGAAWHLGLNDRLTTGAGQTRAANLVHDVMAGTYSSSSITSVPSTLKLPPQLVQAHWG